MKLHRGRPRREERTRVYRMRWLRRRERIARLCDRLDQLVTEAEAAGPLTRTRRELLARADRVREKLKKCDH